jgi:predicted methyltransferase
MKPGSSVLDVGSGSGYLTAVFALMVMLQRMYGTSTYFFIHVTQSAQSYEFASYTVAFNCKILFMQMHILYIVVMPLRIKPSY